jgi:hypothetical protein
VGRGGAALTAKVGVGPGWRGLVPPLPLPPWLEREAPRPVRELQGRVQATAAMAPRRPALAARRQRPLRCAPAEAQLPPPRPCRRANAMAEEREEGAAEDPDRAPLPQTLPLPQALRGSGPATAMAIERMGSKEERATRCRALADEEEGAR